MNTRSNFQDPARCLCGQPEDPRMFACKACWYRVPRVYKEAIAQARRDAEQWLIDEHARTQATSKATKNEPSNANQRGR